MYAGMRPEAHLVIKCDTESVISVWFQSVARERDIVGGWGTTCSRNWAAAQYSWRKLPVSYGKQSDNLELVEVFVKCVK